MSAAEKLTAEEIVALCEGDVRKLPYRSKIPLEEWNGSPAFQGKERPIPFSAEMIRAILAGRQTQTRRVMKFEVTGPNPPNTFDVYRRSSLGGLSWVGAFGADGKGNALKLCPYGQPGDRLWVRETFVIERQCDGERPPHSDGRPLQHETWNQDEGRPWLQPHYRATDPDPELDMGDGSEPHTTWTPSIHMPRWASRLTLLISKVRVERIQQISGADIGAEGVEMIGNYRARWRERWDTLNFKRGFGWDVNPWVWVLDFQVVECKTGRPA